MTRRPYLNAATVAGRLFDRGVGLDEARRDDTLALAVIDMCEAFRCPAGKCSNDYDAIRAALAALWGESERAGRRVECRRYAVSAGRLQ